MEIMLAAIAALLVVGYAAKRVLYTRDRVLAPKSAPPVPALPMRSRALRSAALRGEAEENDTITNVRWPNL